MDQSFIDKKIKAFYVSQSGFLKLCEERGIDLGNGIFEYYLEQGFIAPVEVEGERKNYDPLQIYYISELEQIRRKSLLSSPDKTITWQDALQEYKDSLKSQFEKFKPIFQLLQALRYFYLPQVTGRVVIPEHFFTLEEWKTDCKNFDPKPLMEQYGLSVDDVDNSRAMLLIKGTDIDPSGNASDWFYFFTKVRHVDYKKSLLLTGSVLLAQDYYIMAEMLTKMLQAVKPKGDVLSLEYILDGNAGKWRETECAACHAKFNRKIAAERFCEKCKDKVEVTTKGGWRCQNCKALLLRFQDNNTLLHTLFKGSGKENEIDVAVRLDYGLMTVTCRCKCTHLNVKRVWQGWWPEADLT